MVHFIRLTCLIIILSSITSLLFSQEKKLEFNLGFGPTLDAIHLGGNFKITRKFDFGLSIGTIPNRFDFNDHINIGFETKYKFKESRTIKHRIVTEERMKWAKAKTWYGGLRLNLVTDKSRTNIIKKYIYVTPAIGRHFNFNRFMGLNIDFGLSLTASQTTTDFSNDICFNCFLEEHPQYPLLPTARLQFFIKI